MIRGCEVARPKPWEDDDELWAMVEPLLPKVERRTRHPGRKRHPDRLVFQGILFVLHTGISWEHLPQELGFGSGMTCWRRLAEWTEAGVWPRLHEVLLAELRSANGVEHVFARMKTWKILRDCRLKRARTCLWDLLWSPFQSGSSAWPRRRRCGTTSPVPGQPPSAIVTVLPTAALAPDSSSRSSVPGLRGWPSGWSTTSLPHSTSRPSSSPAPAPST